VRFFGGATLTSRLSNFCDPFHVTLGSFLSHRSLAMSEDNLVELGNAETAESFDNFKLYLNQVCTPLIFAGQKSDAAIQSALTAPESADAVVKFISTSESSVLLVERVGDGSVRVSLDVRMPTGSSGVGAYLAVIKAFEAPLDTKSPIANQVQIISMAIDVAGGSSSDDISHSFFSRLHQLTRHYYAPLARSARGSTHVRLRGHIFLYRHLLTNCSGFLLDLVR
jgi:hypothetical protein